MDLTKQQSSFVYVAVFHLRLHTDQHLTGCSRTNNETCHTQLWSSHVTVRTSLESAELHVKVLLVWSIASLLVAILHMPTFLLTSNKLGIIVPSNSLTLLFFPTFKMLKAMWFQWLELTYWVETIDWLWYSRGRSAHEKSNTREKRRWLGFLDNRLFCLSEF